MVQVGHVRKLQSSRRTKISGNLPVILALQLVTTQKQAQGLTWLLTIQITVIYCNVPALHTIMLRRAYSSTTSYEGCLAYG